MTGYIKLSKENIEDIYKEWNKRVRENPEIFNNELKYTDEDAVDSADYFIEIYNYLTEK